MFYDILSSPIGLITVAVRGERLRELHIEGDRYFQKIPVDWVYAPENELLAQARSELTDYFKGARHDFSVPVAFDGTDFQHQVWRELQHIPTGHTVTYAELAARIGKPKAIRAAGTAVGKNSLCIFVPCHRVVGSDGGLGGYVAGLTRKQYLLEHEQSLRRSYKK